MTRSARNPLALLLAALLCAGGSWLYVHRVLVKYQIADAAAHGRTRGNLSDLYPRWFGARELLLHGRDPYSPEVTRDIQEGYFGRLDPGHPLDQSDQQKFIYPVYVALVLAPTIHQSFPVVRQEALWVLLAITIASVLLWLRVLRWEQPCLAQCAIVILTIGSLPVVQGVKLQQLTLLVAALVALTIWLLATGRPIAAGIALAIATIKPQLVEVLLFWLVLWTLCAWRRRYRWLVSFTLTLATLFAASEFCLPRWLPRFLNAVHDYRSYVDAVPIFYKLIPAHWGVLSMLLVAAATAYAGWKTRGADAQSPGFASTAALMLAVTLVLIPTYALYNQVLLLPALLWLIRDSCDLWRGGALRCVLLLLVVVLLLWPWVTCASLAAASFVLPHTTVEKYWAVPFWTALLLPVGVAALVLLAHCSAPFPTRKSAGAS